MLAPGHLLAGASQGLGRCLLVAVSRCVCVCGGMPSQSIAVCAAARFLPHTLTLCLRSGRDRHEDLYCIGVLSHGSGKDMFQADSDCSRCQLSSWMSEVFVSLLAVSWGHSQQLNISLQLLHEPFKTWSEEKKYPGILFPFRIWPLLSAGTNSAFERLKWID